MQDTPEAPQPEAMWHGPQRSRGRRKPALAWPWEVRVERDGAPAFRGDTGGGAGGAPWPFALRFSQRYVFVLIV